MSKWIHYLRRWALACLVFAVSSGCALGLGKSLHEYSLLDLEQPNKSKASKEVSVETEQYVFLSFVFDTDYADQAYSKIQQVCPGGDIVNIRTKYSTDLGLLAYKNKIRVTGLCVQ